MGNARVVRSYDLTTDADGIKMTLRAYWVRHDGCVDELGFPSLDRFPKHCPECGERLKYPRHLPDEPVSAYRIERVDETCVD